MKLSVVMSTNRPHYWQRCYDYLAKNSIETEVVLVGPSVKNNHPTSLKTVAINSNELPALCWEIGARHATGDLLCLTCDDFIHSDGFFDDVAKIASTNYRKFDSFTPRYVHNDKEQIAGQMMLGIKCMPLLQVAGVMYTSDYLELKGVDRRFRATLWDTDIYMRAFEKGGRTTLLCGHTIHEVGRDSMMFVNFSSGDKVVLDDLWQNGFKRTSAVQSYTDQEIKSCINH